MYSSQPAGAARPQRPAGQAQRPSLPVPLAIKVLGR